MRCFRTVLLFVPAVLQLIGCDSDSSSKDEDAGTTAAVDFEGDVAGECSDAVDNDRDRLFDCDDPDCAGAPDCAGGDDDGDGGDGGDG
ncbi:MAG TPA: hypothetical protein DFR83_00180, partial [Deltaproteobacteria bacterium]|nr:hypothetical protein [Deltaproteobacteria bacterium]